MNITIDGGKMVMAFEYSPALVETVKAMPDGRRYMPSDKTWTAPLTIDNCRHLINNQLDNQAVRDALDSIIQLKPVNDDPALEWGGVKPFAHQVKGTAQLLANDSWGLFFEQGCGKSLCAVKMIEQTGARALVVCPKTVMRSWLGEFRKHSKIEPTLIEGTAAKRKAQLKSQVAIINYDLLSRHAADISVDVVIFDESQFLKSGNAQRTKAAEAIAKKCKKRVLLTGTPIANNALDIFSQYKILDPQIFGTSFYAFREKYFENKGYAFPDWRIKPGSIADIKEKIAMRSYRVLKVDVLDLPEKLYQTQYISMTDEQRRIYKGLERDLIADIPHDGDITTITLQYLLQKLMKLNQVASGFVIDTETGHALDLGSSKLDTLQQVVDDYQAGQNGEGGPVVIFCLFRHDVKRILSVYPDARRIDGDVSAEDRQQAIDDIEGGKSSIIIIQEQTGSLGITLVKPHFVIFYSHSYSLLNRLQAEARCHRIGQVNRVTYLDLVTAGTIEEDIIGALEGKRQLAADIQGDSLAVDILSKFRGGKC